MSAFFVWNAAILVLYIAALWRWPGVQLGILSAWFLFLVLAAVAQLTGLAIA